MSTNHISTLRQHLLDTLADLRDRANPMEPDRARAVAQVASVLVDSAKVEVEYLKASGQTTAPFLEQQEDDTPRLTSTPSPFPQAGITNVTRHRLKG
nr:hypothetical protein [uncultured Albidiferax sp.]